MKEITIRSVVAERILVFQREWARLFAVAAFAFPPYIYYTYGLSAGPVYDRSGNVIWHANYFLLSLAFATFWFLLSCFCFMAAQRALRKLRGSK